MSVSQIRGGMGNITNFGRIVAKRVKEGLYAGRNIGYGNNVSEDGGNKTRRHWKPNSHRKRLYSEVLDRLVSVNVTAHALRCIDKAGGLDAGEIDAVRYAEPGWPAGYWVPYMIRRDDGTMSYAPVDNDEHVQRAPGKQHERPGSGARAHANGRV